MLYIVKMNEFRKNLSKVFIDVAKKNIKRLKSFLSARFLPWMFPILWSSLQEASRTESWLVEDILVARATRFKTDDRNSAVLVRSTWQGNIFSIMKKNY